MEGLEGKKIVVFYDDFKSVSRKEGICTSDSDIEICLNDSVIIPKARIIRIEVLK